MKDYIELRVVMTENKNVQTVDGFQVDVPVEKFNRMTLYFVDLEWFHETIWHKEEEDVPVTLFQHRGIPDPWMTTMPYEELKAQFDEWQSTRTDFRLN